MPGRRLFWKLFVGYLVVVLGAGLAILLLSGWPLAPSAWLLPSAALALPVVLILALWLARRLSRPLEKLTVAAEAMAAGEGHRSLPEVSDDETGRLARALNRLAASARERTETIRSDRNQLYAILAGMVEGVVAVDREERVVHLNTAAARILRVAPGETSGKRIWETTRVREVSEALAAALGGEDVVTRELRLVAGAREQVVEVHASPLRDGEGRTSGAVLVLHDITELRRLEDIRREFVANVSHELKTPLTAIGAIVETLLDDPRMDRETRHRFLAKIGDQSARLSEMVRDLLSLSRIESREARPDHVPVDIRDVVVTSVRSLLPAAEKKKISVELDLPDSQVVVLGDVDGLQQVMGNLLENAIKYTPEEGHVRVRTGASTDEVYLEVEDTGIGIEPQHHDRIFERFYRVDRGRSRDVGGTGLGLSIAKHITLAHGGRLLVRSAPGQGSTFRVTLPPPPASA